MSYLSEMFDKEILLGNEIERQERIEPGSEKKLTGVVIKEDVVENMLDVLITEMIKRRVAGYNMNEEAVEELVKAKAFFLYKKGKTTKGRD